jgi:hypothetical protein
VDGVDTARTLWSPVGFHSPNNAPLAGGTNGGGNLVYPGLRGPIATNRLVNIADGMEDLELFRLLGTGVSPAGAIVSHADDLIVQLVSNMSRGQPVTGAQVLPDPLRLEKVRREAARRVMAKRANNPVHANPADTSHIVQRDNRYLKTDETNVRLGWWTESPTSFGCRGDGMPLPSSTGLCWNRTLALINTKRDCIDRLQMLSGLVVAADGLLSKVTVHSDNITKTYPLELLPRWVPHVRAALGPNKKLDSLLLIPTTDAAHAAYKNVDTLASQLVKLSVDHGFSSINVDYERNCCAGSLDGHCECDSAEAAALARFLGTLSSRLRAVGKTVTLCVNENGAGFLRMPYLQAYLDTGKVERLMEMGTYGISHHSTLAKSEQHRDNITRTLLERYPTDRLGLGVATTLHYSQNGTTLREWFRVLQTYTKRASATAPLEVDVYYLQGGDPDPVQGGKDSPPADWWPLLSQFRHGGAV